MNSLKLLLLLCVYKNLDYEGVGKDCEKIRYDEAMSYLVREEYIHYANSKDLVFSVTEKAQNLITQIILCTN